MSSKRKTNQGDNNGSSRNLDGRRLRTVTEAKALAEYLALKPDMEKKEKEARRKRWQQVVEMAERREEEVRNGGAGKIKGQWFEDKEEAGDRTREAVAVALRLGNYSDKLIADERVSPSSSSEAELIQNDADPSDNQKLTPSGATSTLGKDELTQGKRTRLWGCDDEDAEFLSD